MIGAPLSVGLFSEVLPIAPRPRVAAPLLMERVLPERRSAAATEYFEQVRAMVERLPAPWQRLVDVESSGFDLHFVFERFVGVTVRDVSHALRASRRVLPLDVLRATLDAVLAGLSQLDALPPGGWLFSLSDACCGLGVDGRWAFAYRTLNHWFDEVTPPEWADDPERAPLPDATRDFLSPEAVAGRAETPASTASRGALLAWELAAGGFHPYRQPYSAGGRDGVGDGVLERLRRYQASAPVVPLELHPELPRAVREVLLRGVHFSGGRFADTAALRAALDEAWTVAPASLARTQAVLFGLAWGALRRQLEGLKHAPLLPIRWDGVWAAARTPEEGVAVLEDQLLERLAAPDTLPRAAALPGMRSSARGPADGPGDGRPPVGLLRGLLGRTRR